MTEPNTSIPPEPETSELGVLHEGSTALDTNQKQDK